MIVIHFAKKNLRKHRRKKLIDGVTRLRFARLQLTGRLPSRPRRPSTAKEWARAARRDDHRAARIATYLVIARLVAATPIAGHGGAM
jgi:hypothetical protein